MPREKNTSPVRFRLRPRVLCCRTRARADRVDGGAANNSKCRRLARRLSDAPLEEKTRRRGALTILSPMRLNLLNRNREAGGVERDHSAQRHRCLEETQEPATPSSHNATQRDHRIAINLPCPQDSDYTHLQTAASSKARQNRSPPMLSSIHTSHAHQAPSTQLSTEWQVNNLEPLPRNHTPSSRSFSADCKATKKSRSYAAWRPLLWRSTRCLKILSTSLLSARQIASAGMPHP